MERDASAAAAALADIDVQQDAVRRRIDTERWPPPALGLLLGALAGSLAWRNIVWFTVVAVAFMVSLLPLVGTPARLGVVPRGGRRSLAVAVVACVFVMITPLLAMAGPWWTAIVTGVGAAVFVPAFGRWRRAQERRELPGPAVLPRGPLLRRVDVVVLWPGFVPVAAAVMAGAVLGVWAGWSAAVLVYLPVLFLLQRRQFRVGGTPPEERTARFWVGVFAASAVLFGTPVLSVLGPGRDSWPLAAGHATVVAGTVLLVGWWQQRRLTAAASPR